MWKQRHNAVSTSLAAALCWLLFASAAAHQIRTGQATATTTKQPVEPMCAAGNIKVATGYREAAQSTCDDPACGGSEFPTTYTGYLYCAVANSNILELSQVLSSASGAVYDAVVVPRQQLTVLASTANKLFDGEPSTLSYVTNFYFFLNYQGQEVAMQQPDCNVYRLAYDTVLQDLYYSCYDSTTKKGAIYRTSFTADLNTTTPVVVVPDIGTAVFSAIRMDADNGVVVWTQIAETGTYKDQGVIMTAKRDGTSVKTVATLGAQPQLPTDLSSFNRPFVAGVSINVTRGAILAVTYNEESLNSDSSYARVFGLDGGDPPTSLPLSSSNLFLQGWISLASVDWPGMALHGTLNGAPSNTAEYNSYSYDLVTGDRVQLGVGPVVDDDGQFYSPFVFAEQLACVACPPGSLEAKGVCTVCTPGHYNGAWGQTVCPPCPKGSYNGKSDAFKCTECPAGYSLPQTGATSENQCSPCVPGTWSQQGAGSCTQCTAGRYSSANGATSNSTCSACPAGRSNPNPGSSSSSACAACEAGRYSSTAASPSCTLCAAGKYGNTTGSTSEHAACFSCPPGRANPGTGQSSCVACKKGHYQSKSGQKECVACPAGRFGTAAGATSQSVCQACPLGDLCVKGGSSPTACAPGSYCPGGISAYQCPGDTSCTGQNAWPALEPPSGVRYVAIEGSGSLAAFKLSWFAPAPVTLAHPNGTVLSVTSYNIESESPTGRWTVEGGEASTTVRLHALSTSAPTFKIQSVNNKNVTSAWQIATAGPPEAGCGNPACSGHGSCTSSFQCECTRFLFPLYKGERCGSWAAFQYVIAIGGGVVGLASSIAGLIKLRNAYHTCKKQQKEKQRGQRKNGEAAPLLGDATGSVNATTNSATSAAAPAART